MTPSIASECSFDPSSTTTAWPNSCLSFRDLNDATTQGGCKLLNSSQDSSSPEEPLTLGQGAFSEEAGTESTITSSTSWTRALRDLDMESLSPRSKAVRVVIGDEMPDGYSLTMLAKELGRTPSWVSGRLDELRSEILLNSGYFLPLTDAEFDNLRENIKEFGVQTPILIGEHQLIDGRHRWLISVELGLTDIPAQFILGKTAQYEHDLGVGVNTARRHLSRKQKETIIRAELQRDWSRSSRTIAAMCGVSFPTVESIRAKMRFEAEYEPSHEEVQNVKEEINAWVPPPKEEDVRVTAATDRRPSYKRSAYPDRPPASPRPTGSVVCQSCGVVHNLFNTNEGWRIELA
jgi:hypothetical protein